MHYRGITNTFTPNEFVHIKEGIPFEVALSVACVVHFGKLYPFQDVLKIFVRKFDAEDCSERMASLMRVLNEQFARTSYEDYKLFLESFDKKTGPITLADLVAYHSETCLELVFVNREGQPVCMSQIMCSLHFDYPKGAVLTYNELIFFAPAEDTVEPYDFLPGQFHILFQKKFSKNLIRRFKASKFSLELCDNLLAGDGLSTEAAPSMRSFLKSLERAKVHFRFFHIY